MVSQGEAKAVPYYEKVKVGIELYVEKIEENEKRPLHAGDGIYRHKKRTIISNRLCWVIGGNTSWDKDCIGYVYRSDRDMVFCEKCTVLVGR